MILPCHVPGRVLKPRVIEKAVTFKEHAGIRHRPESVAVLAPGDPLPVRGWEAEEQVYRIRKTTDSSLTIVTSRRSQGAKSAYDRMPRWRSPSLQQVGAAVRFTGVSDYVAEAVTPSPMYSVSKESQRSR